MITTWILSVVSSVVVSLASLIGLLTLSVDESRVRPLASVLISFAVGCLLGDTFLHLFPLMFAGDGASPVVDSRSRGRFAIFVVEKLLRHSHGPIHRHHHPEILRPELVAINVVGDLVSPTLGVSTTLAVLLHEIPQELSDFSILVHCGLGVRNATFLNVASASIALLGTFVALVLGSDAWRALPVILVPLTGGGFLYIALADLIPELQHERTVRSFGIQMSLIALGIGLMALLAIAE